MEYNPVTERNDILDCMTYISQSDLDKIDYLRENLAYINEPHEYAAVNVKEIDYLKDMVRQLSFELCELRNIIQDKGIVFEESCDEKYAEDWRET